MKPLRAAARSAVPWKNGGGTTAAVVVMPPTAGYDDFDWRISLAEVRKAGAFSRFDGVDRTLCVLGGGVLELTIGGHAAQPLTAHSAPLPFAGELPVHAGLPAGTVRDCNVMTRRGRYAHRVERVRIAHGCTLAPARVATVLLAVDGGLAVGSADARIELAADDAVCLEPGDGIATLAAPSPVEVLIATILPA